MPPEMMWFGPRWDAPVCETTEEAPAPIGAECARAACAEKIAEGDRGFLVAHLEADVVTGPSGLVGLHYKAWHRDCFLKEVIGPAWPPSQS